MTEREALKMALVALENTTPTGFNMERDKQFFAAITAIREALAQPEQEPVAWFRYETVYEYKNQLARCTKDCIGAFPVYTFPPKRESEPVIDKSAAIRIATSLGWEPKRKPLSEERIDDIWNLHCDEMGYVSVSDAVELARDFEAAHGIKE